MILKVFAIFDKVAGFYGAPFFLTSVGEARRAFSDLANDLNTNIGRHPGDFALFELGSFDNETGHWMVETPVHLAGGINMLRPQAELPLNQEA